MGAEVVPMPQKKIGNQTPTKSVILPYDAKKSLGHEAIEIYEKSGRTVFDWQRFLIDAILARNNDGLWTHMMFGFSVPRQNGKNEVVAIRELFGLFKGEKILHTAHRTTTSAAAFNRLLAILEEMGLEEGEHFHKIKAAGREHIELVDGGRIDFRTRTSTGGLGESFDLLVIDEAQEYTDDQRSALMYTIAASPNPQTIMIGTPPTPISSGTVFTKYRENVLYGATEDSGWAEWSVDKESDPRDKELWYQANPSLGLRVSERNIQAEVGNDDLDFNIQRLGLWIQYNQKSAISENEWQALHVDRLPQLKGKLFVGVKYGHDGTNVAMSIAVKTHDDKIFVEAIDCQSIRNGNDWIIHFLRNADVQQVVVDGANGQKILEDAMKLAKLKPPILPTVKEVIQANAMFEQAVYQQTIQHRSQPSLFQVVTNCEKRPIGTSGGFGYKSQIEEYDIALLDSVILAHWIASNDKPKKPQRIRY
jgi:phage terminase large subunit-like protein